MQLVVTNQDSTPVSARQWAYHHTSSQMQNTHKAMGRPSDRPDPLAHIGQWSASFGKVVNRSDNGVSQDRDLIIRQSMISYAVVSL